MQAEVIAIGDELTTGQRLDTNSQWLSTELGLLGIPVCFHTTVCDTLEAGIDAFRIAAARCDLVVATGGLGPTADDLTRDVLAAVSGQPLDLSAAALEAVESRFARRAVAMPESNRRQAMFPRGTRIIPNPDGTAPGIDLDVRRPDGGTSRIIALPGVPSEMREMWRGTVASALAAMLPDAGVFVHRRIKCFGAGESAVEEMLPDLIRRGRDPLVGITAHEATITLRILARGSDEAECLAKIAPTERTIRECLGPHVYGIEDDEVEDAAVRALAGAGQTLGTIEIGTEGKIDARKNSVSSRAGFGNAIVEVIDDINVVAFSALQNIITGAPINAVTIQTIITFSTSQCVITRACPTINTVSIQTVIASITLDHIVAIITYQGVVTTTTQQTVIAQTAIQRH